MQYPARVGMPSLLRLLLAAFAFGFGRSQIDIGSCTSEGIFCLADEDCSVCAEQLQDLQDAGTITSNSDCLTFFGEVCSAIDETCDVTNSLLVDLAACLAEDQLGCTGFTSTTCAEATATPAPSAMPTTMATEAATEAATGAPTTMATGAATGAPTMMVTMAATGAPSMAPSMAPTATTGAPTMGPTATAGASTIAPGSTEGPAGSPTPSPGSPDETGTEADAGVRLSSAATATTTLVGLTLVVGLWVVPSLVL